MSGQTHLVYIHGFNSSPESKKAVMLAEAASDIGLADYYHVPGLPFSPRACMEILDETLSGLGGEPVCLVGSSMGGFYSINLAHRYEVRAVLVNPAIDPHLLFGNYLGELKNDYTGERYEFSVEDLHALEEYNIDTIRYPDRFLTLLQAGDETLDYRKAQERMREGSLSVQRGGSHGFDHFEDFIPQIFRFAGFNPG